MILTALRSSLYLQVVAAIAAGILLGALFPEASAALEPLGIGFVKLIKMLIAPIIFCTVVLGIAGMEDMRKVGKTGGLALLYFETVTTVALLIGLLVVNAARPGAGMNVDISGIDASSVSKYTTAKGPQSVPEFLLDLIPGTILDAFVRGEILQVLLFSILFGSALHALGERGRLLFGFIEQFSGAMFRIVGIVMRIAPVGAFGAMAFTIGMYGLDSLLSLGKLLACFYLTCLIFVFGVLGLIARAHGLRITRFLALFKEELFIVLGTSSSESALPRMIAKLEAAGVEKSVVGLVIPTGYSFNLDGTSIYLTMAAVFIAQATNTPMDFGQQMTLLLILLLTSKGAAGVTGSGFIVLAATLSAVGQVPVAGVALILGIDRFMSEARALTNTIGNGVATVVVGKWCRAVDAATLHAQLGPRR